MSTYPEHEKLKGLRGQNQIVGDFIEWLGETGFVIARYTRSGHTLLPAHASRDDFLADFFEIDRDRLEAEKRQMIESLSGSADA